MRIVMDKPKQSLKAQLASKFGGGTIAKQAAQKVSQSPCRSMKLGGHADYHNTKHTPKPQALLSRAGTASPLSSHVAAQAADGATAAHSGPESTDTHHGSKLQAAAHGSTPHSKTSGESNSTAAARTPRKQDMSPRGSRHMSPRGKAAPPAGASAHQERTPTLHMHVGPSRGISAAHVAASENANVDAACSHAPAANGMDEIMEVMQALEQQQIACSTGFPASSPGSGASAAEDTQATACDAGALGSKHAQGESAQQASFGPESAAAEGVVAGTTGPGAPIHSSESPVRPARRQAAAAAAAMDAEGAAAGPAGRQPPAAVAAEKQHQQQEQQQRGPPGGGGADDGNTFYKTWRVRTHRPSSPDYVYSQPGSEGVMVRAGGCQAWHGFDCSLTWVGCSCKGVATCHLLDGWDPSAVPKLMQSCVPFHEGVVDSVDYMLVSMSTNSFLSPQDGHHCFPNVQHVTEFDTTTRSPAHQAPVKQQVWSFDPTHPALASQHYLRTTEQNEALKRLQAQRDAAQLRLEAQRAQHELHARHSWSADGMNSASGKKRLRQPQPQCKKQQGTGGVRGSKEGLSEEEVIQVLAEHWQGAAVAGGAVDGGRPVTAGQACAGGGAKEQVSMHSVHICISCFRIVASHVARCM